MGHAHRVHSKAGRRARGRSPLRFVAVSVKRLCLSAVGHGGGYRFVAHSLNGKKMRFALAGCGHVRGHGGTRLCGVPVVARRLVGTWRFSARRVVVELLADMVKRP